MPTKNFPTYLFLGEEEFLKEQSVEKLKTEFLNKQTKDLNYSVFYAKDKNFNINELLNSLNTLPFLSKKRLVVLKDAESLPPSYRQGVFSYLQTPRQTSVFVIESTSPVIKGEFLLEISRYATLSYYRRLTDSDLNVWLSKKANLYGKKISIEAVRAIKENLPNDLMTLSSNMDSIILYIGKRSSITKEDVENVIGISPSHTAFDLIDTIARKDAKNALRIFAYLKKDKKRETELLGLLAWNARLLLRAKELLRIKDKLEVRRDLGLKPQVFGQLVQNASGFKRGEIFALLDEILKADVDIKTGMPPATVIERLIVKMCF